MEQKVTILRRRKTGCPRMKVNRTGEMEYLTFPAFDQTEEVTCLVSTRLGGVSTGDCASLNFSYLRDTNQAAVDENFRRWRRYSGRSRMPLCVRIRPIR